MYPEEDLEKEYSGYWRDEKRHGKGTLEWKEGHKYEGSFEDDQQHGEGTFIWKNGAVYSGGWVKGRREGYAMYKWAEGSSKNGEYCCYKGMCKENKFHGYGVLYLANGDRYEGLIIL